MTLEIETREIPLNRLRVSKINARRTDRKADIDALAASITSLGLLQNLSVIASDDEETFDVVAGGRRLAALKLLAKSGAVAKNYPVPCRIVTREGASEASLAENVQRVAMDPLDEADAYAELGKQGQALSTIAERFGMTIRHVEQRLALVNLSPKLKTAWKKGELTLDAARAFCIVADHARQDAVYKSMGKPITHAGSVRARLMDGHMRVSDRLVTFIGLGAYEAAGGGVSCDLFDAEAVFITDPGLVAKLAEEKLSAAAVEWKGKGWGWVAQNLDDARLEGLSATRIYPEWRDPTDFETAQMQQLQEKIGTLDAALEESSVEDDPRWSDRDDLEAAYETIRQSAREWNPALMEVSGVVLGVDRAGALHVVEGLVRIDDETRVAEIRRGEEEPDETADKDAEDDAPEPRSAIPRSLARELTHARSLAISEGISTNPQLALAICVASLTLRLHGRGGVAGIELSLRQGAWTGHAGEIEGSDAEVVPNTAAEALKQCLLSDEQTLMASLARLVARAIDLTHEDATRADADRQQVADALAAGLALDMRTCWSPDLDYWMRLSKAALLEELDNVDEMDGVSERRRRDRQTSAAKLKKDALAQRVENTWRGRGYLPELLVTPLLAGALGAESGFAIAAE